MSTPILSEAARFGPYAFMLSLFLLAGLVVLNRVLKVVENNTRVIATLAGTSDKTCEDLAKHDQRAERMEAVVVATGRTVERIERRVEHISDAVGKPPATAAVGDRAA